MFERIQKMKRDDFMRWYEKPRGNKKPLHDILAGGDWKDEPCFLIGGGNSLAGFDFERLRRARARVIVCNKGFMSVPFADIMVAMDSDFYSAIHKNTLGAEVKKRFLAFPGFKVWIDLNNYRMMNVHYVFRCSYPVINKKLKNGIFCGNNTGTGSLALAATLGCNPIYLLGFDMMITKGKGHFHDGYHRKMAESTPKTFIKHFNKLAPALKKAGIDVVNLNRQSGLRCFQFGEVENAIARSS